MKHTLLIVDDDDEILDIFKGIFEDEGYRVLTQQSGKTTLKLLETESIQLVLLDIWMDDCDGIDILQQIKHVHRSLPVIMISGHGDVATAVKTTKLGAYDFIEKPPDFHKMVRMVKDVLMECTPDANQKKSRKLSHEPKAPAPEIVGNHPLIKSLLEQIKMAAPTDGRILIYGENGTGKEVIAGMIHALSKRAAFPFVELNCAAIPEQLIENELFGHEKGAFTGADRKKIGKFDQAHKGTLFLDEIADMSPGTQAKILRVLQEQRFERVGGNELIQADVRIIAASNKRLEDEIAAGNFREDLFYRLNILPLTVPSLRERASDIALLVDHFNHHFFTTAGYPLKKFNDDIFNVLMRYRWPGNVRELKNLVERMMIISRNETITIDDIPPSIVKDAEQSGQNVWVASNENDVLGGNTSAMSSKTMKEARDEFEKHFIIEMLRKNNGNVAKTADQIRMERSYLHKKIKQHNIATD